MKTRSLVFEVEESIVVRSTGQAFVLARQLEPSQWELGDDPRLGGIRIHPVAEVPRVFEPSGKPRQDLFAFCLREAADLAQFPKGQVVELKP